MHARTQPPNRRHSFQVSPNPSPFFPHSIDPSQPFASIRLFTHLSTRILSVSSCALLCLYPRSSLACAFLPASFLFPPFPLVPSFPLPPPLSRRSPSRCPVPPLPRRPFPTFPPAPTTSRPPSSVQAPLSHHILHSSRISLATADPVPGSLFFFSPLLPSHHLCATLPSLSLSPRPPLPCFPASPSASRFRPAARWPRFPRPDSEKKAGKKPPKPRTVPRRWRCSALGRKRGGCTRRGFEAVLHVPFKAHLKSTFFILLLAAPRNARSPSFARPRPRCDATRASSVQAERQERGKRGEGRRGGVRLESVVGRLC